MHVEICVCHEGKRWCEHHDEHTYRARVKQLIEEGAAIYWMLRHL